MDPIVESLMKKHRLVEANVGVFYYIFNKLYSDDVSVRDGDTYGGFVNYGSHYDFWRELSRTSRMFSDAAYDSFPRGRVIFDKNQNKYIIYIDKKLDNPTVIDKIADKFGLRSGSYIVNSEDEHYVSRF